LDIKIVNTVEALLFGAGRPLRLSEIRGLLESDGLIAELSDIPDLKLSHQIDFEELSTQERIQIILDILSRRNVISFSKTLRKSEGRHGVVVTFLASLELAKDGHVELIQNKTEEMFLKSLRGA